jgi:predicted anti-sigma-YlaC factor YlaD
MTCQQFQDRLPELLGSGENLSAHPHLQQCARCRALIADLETIAEAARQLYPVADPPDRLWAQIESAIEKEDATPDSKDKPE